MVINVFIGGPLENQLFEGQPSLKELNMKYENIITIIQQGNHNDSDNRRNTCKSLLHITL